MNKYLDMAGYDPNCGTYRRLLLGYGECKLLFVSLLDIIKINMIKRTGVSSALNVKVREGTQIHGIIIETLTE